MGGVRSEMVGVEGNEGGYCMDSSCVCLPKVVQLSEEAFLKQA